jgi:hypothetical protein
VLVGGAGNDVVSNDLTGNNGQDWFFAGSADQVHDKKHDETVT